MNTYTVTVAESYVVDGPAILKTVTIKADRYGRAWGGNSVADVYDFYIDTPFTERNDNWIFNKFSTFTRSEVISTYHNVIAVVKQDG